MRGLAIDSRDIRRMAIGRGIYSGAAGVPSATVSTPTYRGPSGAAVCRLERVADTTLGYALLTASRPGVDTLDVGTRIRLALWYRGTVSTALSISTDPSTAVVTLNPALPALDGTAPDTWKRLVSGWVTTGASAWLPTSAGSASTWQSLRFACSATSYANWIEWSDVVLIVGH